LLLVLAAVLVVVAILRPGEPRYKGRPVSTWLRELGGAGPERAHQAEEAIRAFGTNALPMLRLKMQTRDSPLKVALVRLFWMQDKVKLRVLMARGWHMRAALGCEILGTNALPLIPDLLQLSTEDFISFELAVGALSHMREPAVPALTASLANPKVRIRETSVRALGALGPEAKTAVVAITKCLKDPDARVRSEASLALGTIGVASPEVVDALAAGLFDTNSEVRDNIVDVLGQFGHDAKGAMPTLLRLLTDADEQVRRDATNAFDSIETEADDNNK
jgi:HEAT repeat protein